MDTPSFFDRILDTILQKLFFHMEEGECNGYPWFRVVYKVFGIKVHRGKWTPNFHVFTIKRIFNSQADLDRFNGALDKFIKDHPQKADYIPKQ